MEPHLRSVVSAAAQTPAVSRTVPAFGPAVGNNVVIVVGTGFASGASVAFGGVPATSVSVVNATTLTANVPPHSAGAVGVTVTNPGGTSGSLAGAYRYLAPSGTFGIQFFPVTTGAVTDVAAGSDGNLWFLNNGGETLDPWSVSRLTPAGAFTNFPFLDAGQLTDIAPGPDGNLWYTRTGPDRIGRITPSGTATEFSLSPGRDPRGVVAGPDGAVWFTEPGASGVGRMTTGGSLGEYSVATYPHGITLGPDGALWLAGCSVATAAGT